MRSILIIFLTFFPLISYSQLEKIIDQALNFETYLEAGKFLQKNMIFLEKAQFVKSEDIVLSDKIEFMFTAVNAENTKEKGEFVFMKMSFDNYQEARLFLEKKTNVKKIKISIKRFVNLPDVEKYPPTKAEAEAFFGEIGFWLKKGFAARAKSDYFKAMEFFQKAYEKNNKNWLVINILRNIVLEGVRYYQQQKKSIDALQILGMLDNTHSWALNDLLSKKSEIINHELDKIEEMKKNGKHIEALELINSLPIDNTEFRLVMKAQEIRRELEQYQLEQFAKQFKSLELKEDQLKEWLEKGRALKKNEELRAEAKAIFATMIEKYPQHPLADDARYELGACYYLGALEDTVDVALYFKGLKVSSDTLAAKICYMIARCYRDRELPEMAEYYYQKVAKKYPQSRFADDALLILAYDEKDYLKSIPKYQKVVDNYPNGDKAEDAAYKVSELLFRTEQYDKSVTSWNNYLTNFATNHYYKESAYNYLFKCYRQLNKFMEIEALIQRMAEEKLESTIELACRLASIYYYELDNKEKAKAILEIIPRDEWNLEIAALATFFKKGDFSDYLLSKYPIRFQEKPQVKLKTAEEYYNQAEQTQSMSQVYDLLTRSLLLKPTQPLLSKIHYKRARLLFDADEYWEAIKIFDSNQIQESELKILSQFYKSSSFFAIGNSQQTKKILNSICLERTDNFLCDDALFRLTVLEFRPQQIKSHLRAILNYSPTGDMAEDAADWLARIYLHVDRNYDSTVYVIDHKISLQPQISDDNFRYIKNDCIHRQGLHFIVSRQYDQAENYSKKLYSVNSELAIQGICELSDFLKYESNDAHRAREVLKYFSRLSPNHPEIKKRL